MNQYIQITYKPSWASNPNYWDIWFALNNKYHREKSPSVIRNNGYWDWLECMNQWIEIRYKPFWKLDFWFIIFRINCKQYREKAPSSLNLRGEWQWLIHGKIKKNGRNWDWDKQ